MKRIKSAKQLTFTYFSVVAFAIIVIHFSVLESTIENLENFNAQNRLEMAATQLQEGNDTTSVQTLDSYTTAYIAWMPCLRMCRCPRKCRGTKRLRSINPEPGRRQSTS